jgi:hypothetical protein
MAVNETAQQDNERSRRAPAELERAADTEAIQETATEIGVDAPGIVHSPGSRSSVNSPVYASAVQRMQQTYGNRATRAFVQRSRAGTVPVQRHPVEEGKKDEEEEKPGPVLKMPAGNRGAGLVAVQRDGDEDKATTGTGTTGATATTGSSGASATTTTPAPLTPTDPKRIDNAKDLCKKTTGGQHAVDVIDTNKVAVAFGTSGGGAFFSASANKITLDPADSDPDQAFTLVHEATHAEYSHSGKTANTGALIVSLSKEDYVKKMLDEETEATALQIELKIDLEAIPGQSLTGATEQAGEKSYRKGYKEEFDKAKAASKTDAEAKEAGKKGGRVLVRKDFQEGLTIVTSTTGEAYSVYYGKAWDNAHPSGSGTGGATK